MELLRTLPNMSKFGINNSAEKNTVYNGYRWFFIKGTDQPIKYEIPPNVEIISSIPYYIAMLNKEKNKILKVFAGLAEAIKGININRKHTIIESIKNNKLVHSRYYFAVFNNCDENLKREYLRKNRLPELILNRGTKINQIDIKTKEVIKTYNSISDVLKQFCISRQTLKDACENGEAKKGFLWEFRE